MALDGTYAGLQSSVAAWLHRTDLTAVIPSDLIVLAEQRISRELRLRAQLTVAALTTVAGTQALALPTDYLEAETVTVTGSPVRNLDFMTPQELALKFPIGYCTALPAVYSILGTNLLFGPTPDAAYPLAMAYYAKFPALSASNATNWLLANHAAIYLFGALAEAETYNNHDERSTTWEAKYQHELKTLQAADDRAAHSGSVLRVRKA
ncbi:MAG: hypothetical protein V4505_25615 [Pseudomonadota bacterium]